MTGEKVYYKPVEIKTLQANVRNYSSNVLYWIGGIAIVRNYSSNVLYWMGGIAIGMVLLLVFVTHKLARKGYVHVGQDDTMIA